MKIFAFKASLAVYLLAPALAMASASFSDRTSLEFKLDGKGYTSIDASWTDLWAVLKQSDSSSAAQEFQATSLNWSLFRGDTLKASGTFNDLAGESNSGKIVIDETGLKSDTYKLKFAGVWSPTGGKRAWDATVEQRVALGNVSPVPELDTYAMLLAGLGLMGTIALRRNKSDAS
jgi:hypothetical protein